MNNLKKVIIILIVIILIILLTIFLIVRNLKKSVDENGNVKEPEYIENSYEFDNKMKNIGDRTKYLIIKGIVNNTQIYINYLNYDLSGSRVQFNNEKEEKEFLDNYKNEGISKLKTLMPKDYIEQYGITDKIIYDKFKQFANKNLMIQNVYISENSANINTYIVYLSTIDTNEELTLEIVTDSSNSTFYIMMDDYISKMNLTKDNIIGTEVKQEIQNIETNENNIYDIPNIDDKTYIQEIFEEYKGYLENYPKIAYEKLNSEYKKSRFSNIQKFKKYLEENSINIEDMEVSKYEVNKYDNYNEYVCMDQYRKLYYICGR